MFALLDHLEFGIVFSKEVVQLSDQAFHSRNEFDQTFGNQHRTEVVAFGSTFCYNSGDVSHDIVQRHVLFLNFFGDDTNIRLSLQSAFQSDVRSRTSHQLDEVPVLLCRVAVTLDITDNFGINLTSRVETERSFDLLVLQVTVDRLRTADYLNTGPRSLVVFGQYASICVGVVATNDNQCLDVQFFQNFQPLVELFFCFQFGTA